MCPGSSDTQLSLSPDTHSKGAKGAKGARLKAHRRAPAHTPENMASWGP